MDELTPEERVAVEEFNNSDDYTKRLILFQTLMSLLTKAVADDDIEMIKPYARLATETWNNLGEGEE